MSISTKTVETPKFAVRESKFIEPGIDLNGVKITSMTTPEVTKDKSTYVHFKFEDTKGRTTDVKLYTSKASEDKTLERIKHIATEITGDVTLVDNITGETWAEYAKNMFKLIGGKLYRQKFNGKEIPGGTDDQGNKKPNWFKAVIGFLNKYNKLAEPLNTTPSRLRFDWNNTFDVERIPVADIVANGLVPSNDLPF